MPPLRLFISHAHEDKPLADALQAMITQVFPPGAAQSVQVDYSSDNSPGRGINPGATWLEWILSVVRDTDVCVVVLTANSVSAPWLTWEAGAVTGVAMGTALLADRMAAKATVVPLLFGIGVEHIPAPLQHQRAVNGEQPMEVRQLLFSLHQLSSSADPFPDRSARPKVSRFIRDVQRAMQARMREHPARLRLPDKAPIHFINSRHGLTLEPYEGEIGNGVRLRCGKFTGDLHQAWLLYPVTKHVYKVVTSDKTKCISVQDDARTPGATILLWDYEGDETQHWQVVSDPDTANTLSTVRIVNNASNLCLIPRPADRQIVQTKAGNFSDEDWWILTAPLLPSV